MLKQEKFAFDILGMIIVNMCLSEDISQHWKQ